MENLILKLDQPVYVAKPIIGEEELEEIHSVLQSGSLVDGPVTKEFEKEFANYLGMKHAILCTNGTTALHLALEALEIPPGGHIFTSAFTFIASSNSILFVGGIPHFIDIDEDTFCLDPIKIEEAIHTEGVSGIMPIHIFGLPSNMDETVRIAQEHELKVIEDCAQAHGAKIRGKHVGKFGDLACFSFYATKNMIAGEGGVVATDDSELAFKCKQIRNHGRPPTGGYRHEKVGYNFRATELAAAILKVQLGKLPNLLKIRERNVKILKDFLQEIPSISFQHVPKDFTHANYICALKVQDSALSINKIIDELKKRNIYARRVYDVPCHHQPAYQNIKNWRWAKYVNYPDYKSLSLPITEKIAQNHFEVPIHPGISEETMVLISENTKDVLNKT